jgi:4-carboxymuconolactone decarboxylase
MRLDKPRVAPTTSADWDDDTRRLLEQMASYNDGVVMNVLSTIAHHPQLLRRWTVFGNHVMGASTLPARERELAVLRVGVLTRCDYEWTQHVAIARRCGVTDDEIARVIGGADAAGWSDDDSAVLRATDELVADQFVSDATWSALACRWNVQQCIDLVFAVGQYCLVAMALNTLGVEIEEGAVRFPIDPFADD